MNLSALAGWVEAHPTLVALVLVPACTALFNLLFKPKTPEQYAKIATFSPRLAALLQLFGALGVDPQKAAKIFFEKIVKSPPPPAPPSGPSRVPSSDPPPASMKNAARAMILVAILCAIPGCALLTKKTAKTALDAIAVTCIFQSELTDEAALADACDVARDLIPIIKNLIGQREAAKRSGVHWSKQ